MLWEQNALENIQILIISSRMSTTLENSASTVIIYIYNLIFHENSWWADFQKQIILINIEGGLTREFKKVVSNYFPPLVFLELVNKE